LTTRIHKYQIPAVANLKVAMPAGAKILSFQLQKGIPTIWAEVDPAARPVERRFVAYGTGKDLPPPERRAYVGTYQCDGGETVWHVFEEL